MMSWTEDRGIKKYAMRMTGYMLTPFHHFRAVPKEGYEKCHGVVVFLRRSIQGNLRNRSEVQ